MQLYQKETEKALQNFTISNIPFSFALAQSIAMVKYATAEGHQKEGRLAAPTAEAIKQASQEILNGQWQEQFVVDQIQGGAGTSMHMNVNEVIASRATEILATGERVHPNDHVNMSQSTNDVIPTAIKITTLQLLDKLIAVYEIFGSELEKKSITFADIVKVGRTHLQDAVPITLGQEFGAHAYRIKHDTERLVHVKKSLYELNLGGSAVGTGLTGSRAYVEFATESLKNISGYPVFASPNLIAATQYPDAFLEVSGVLTLLAANLIKMMNDLRLLGSGPLAGIGEIHLAEIQKGSSIMPGKVNPVMAEMMNQICFQVIGNNQTILMATQAGQLELNVMLPIVSKNICESLTILTNGLSQFTALCLTTLEANKEKCDELFQKSLCMATALSPKIGYDQTAALVKKAVAERKNLKDIVQEENIMNAEEFQKFFEPKNLTELH